MKPKFNRCMIVNHTIEDIKGAPHHVVRIYPPESPNEYKTGRWSVTDEETSLHAIWSGFFEARDAVDLFNADGIAVYSTDKAAFDAYCAETHADD